MRAACLPIAILTAGLAACSSKSPAHPDTTPAPYCTATAGTHLKLVPIVSGLTEPIFATAPTGDPRLFVIERAGKIRLVGADHLLRDAPWFDISSQVLKTGSEQGLLGLAFHPDFAKTGRFYVDYTRTPDGAEVIAEYTVDPAAETVQAQPRVLITQDDPAENHNGGMLQFGADGFLYISIGDGGGGGDTYHNGQNPQTLMAKILRIDPDHPAGGKPYGIPADNPWASGPGVPEMYVWGLRNPWRFAIDRPTGDLYIADVGQGAVEEVDVVPRAGRGENLGWPVFEGTTCFGNAAGCSDPKPYTTPIDTYGHSSGRCSIIGGSVYRGTCMPDVVGTYFYGDYCSNEIWSLVYADGRSRRRPIAPPRSG